MNIHAILSLIMTLRRASVILGIAIVCVAVGIGVYSFFSPKPPSFVAQLLHIKKPEVVGFQPYWLAKTGKDSYAPFITTLTYFGLAVGPDGHIRTEDAPGEWEPGWAMLSNDEYKASLQAEKKRGVKLSLLIANMNADEIASMLESPEVSAQNLLSDVAPVMVNNGFSDLNLDIEDFSIASDSTRAKYVSFVREVKKQLVEQKLGTLSVELTPKSPVEKHFIDVSEIGKLADRVILMAYDYHYSLSETAGPVAPLSGAPDVRDYDVAVALEETIRQIPKEKVILGIPLYGYEWETLSDTPGSPTISKSWSVISGKKAVEFLSGCATCSAQFDEVSKSPYVVYPGESDHMHQLFYENTLSVQAKVDFALQKQIAGVAFWALGYESEDMLTPVKKYRSATLPLESTHDDTLATVSAFTVSAPIQSVKGVFSKREGTVNIWKRHAEGYVPVTDEQVEEGDALFVDSDGSVEVTFGTLATLSIDPYSEIDASALVPPNAVVTQKTGTITYTLLDATQTFSVRTNHVLLTLTSGSVEVSMEGDYTYIKQIEGTSVLGYIDDTNTTYTKYLSSGDSAKTYYPNRSVVIY